MAAFSIAMVSATTAADSEVGFGRTIPSIGWGLRILIAGWPAGTPGFRVAPALTGQIVAAVSETPETWVLMARDRRSRHSPRATARRLVVGVALANRGRRKAAHLQRVSLVVPAPSPVIVLA